MPQLALNYSQRDVTDVLLQLYQQIAGFTNNQWTDYLNSDVGTALIQTMETLEDFNAFFVDANTAECFLSTCQDRESAIRLAKMLNYPVGLAQAATCEILVTCPSFGHEVDLPANTVWAINNIAFTCPDPIVISSSQTSLQLSLIQGTPFTSTVSANGNPWFQITIPNNATGIVVKVNDVVYEETDTWIVVPQANSYKRYESVAGQVIEFGNGLTSTQPNLSDSIVITAILTDGLAGNVQLTQQNVVPKSALRDPFDSLLINNTITAVNLTAPVNGANVETIQSIQENAPAFYGTQGRVVTANDYAAVVKKVPGVVDYKVVGGENIGFYRYVYITVYGSNPYSVDGTLLDDIKAALQLINVVPITPVVQAPQIFELTMSVNLGLLQNSFTDASVARNLVNTAITTFFSAPSVGGQMGIGTNLRNSALASAIQAVPGIDFADIQFSVDSFAHSAAGIIRIPVPENVDVTSCTLVNATDVVLFTGDGTQYVANNLFTFSVPHMSDQLCTLTYSVKPPVGKQTFDCLIQYNQLILLTSLDLTTEFVTP